MGSKSDTETFLNFMAKLKLHKALQSYWNFSGEGRKLLTPHYHLLQSCVRGLNRATAFCCFLLRSRH